MPDIVQNPEYVLLRDSPTHQAEHLIHVLLDVLKFIEQHSLGVTLDSEVEDPEIYAVVGTLVNIVHVYLCHHHPDVEELAESLVLYYLIQN